MITRIPVSELYAHPNNPRKDLGDLTELADSIKANGVFQNLTVVKADNGYTVIIGHRRLAAAKLAGLETVPCSVVEMTEKEQLSTMLAENMQRADLTVYEQAQGFQMMMDLGCTMDEIAEKSGFSKTTIKHRLNIAKLDAEKAKKASERGATLMDFIELEKLNDPKEKNLVLQSLGTNNFKNALSTAMERQKQAQRKANYIKELSKFAIEIEYPKLTDKGYQTKIGDETVTVAYKQNYRYWQTTEVEPFPNEEGIHYYFSIGSFQIDLWCTAQEKTTEETLEAARERKRREKLAARRREADDINTRHKVLREDFVKGLKHIRGVMPELMMYFGELLSCNEEIPAVMICDVLGVDSYEEMISKFGEINTDKGILAVIYAAGENSAAAGYSKYNWTSERTEHCTNADLDRLYDILQMLGYQMSDEEKEMQDGTHEIFTRDIEED